MPYHYRHSAPEPETTVTPGDLVLDLVRGPTRSILPYDDITRLRLVYNPSRINTARHECHVYHRGGPKLVITSTTYKGFGRFEDQSDAFRDCIVDIHRRLAGRPGIDFISGDSPKRYWITLGAVVFVLLMLAAALFAFGLLSVPAVAVAKLVILAASIPWLIKYARVNKPGSYDPAAVPDDLLP